MKAKKNEPLSNIGARTMQVMDKGASVTPTTPATSGTETTRTASLATSIEEIIPLWNKRQRIGDNLKYKANSRSFSVWDDVGVTLARAQETFITEEMKVFSSMSPNKVMGCHLHTLVQVMYLCKFIFSFPFLSFFFFFFLHCFEVWFLLSGAGGEPSHYLEVSYSGDQGPICSIQGGGLGGGELKVEERLDCCYG